MFHSYFDEYAFDDIFLLDFSYRETIPNYHQLPTAGFYLYQMV